MSRGVIFAAGQYPLRPRRWQEEVARALDRTNHSYAACLEAGVPRIPYVAAAIAVPRHPQGGPGNEGLLYGGMPHWRNGYLLGQWALDEQAREQAGNGLPVVIGTPGMCLGEFDVGPGGGRLITAIERWRYRLNGRLPLLDDRALALMAGGQCLDGRKAREELGFVAQQSLDDTLGRAIRWFRANGYLGN